MKKLVRSSMIVIMGVMIAQFALADAKDVPVSVGATQGSDAPFTQIHFDPQTSARIYALLASAEKPEASNVANFGKTILNSDGSRALLDCMKFSDSAISCDLLIAGVEGTADVQVFANAPTPIVDIRGYTAALLYIAMSGSDGALEQNVQNKGKQILDVNQKPLLQCMRYTGGGVDCTFFLPH